MLRTLCTTILCFCTLQSFASWQLIKTPNNPTPRHENGFVAHHDKLYLIGGRGFLRVEEFDPTTKSWVKKSPPPIEMHHITPVSMGNKIIVATGLTGHYPNEKPLTHIYEYYPSQDRWVKAAEIPENRRRGAAGVVLHNETIYIVGGIINGHTSGTTNFFDSFDVKTSQWVVHDDSPRERDHTNAVIVGNHLFSLGGRNTSYHEKGNFEAFMDQVIAEVDVYNLATQSWSTLDVKLPNPTGGGSAIAHNGAVFYTGGETGALNANDRMVKLDSLYKDWKDVGRLNQGRHGTNIVELNGYLYIAAGSGQRGGTPELSSIEKYSVEK